jgi:hypothetical protein
MRVSPLIVAVLLTSGASALGQTEIAQFGDGDQTARNSLDRQGLSVLQRAAATVLDAYSSEVAAPITTTGNIRQHGSNIINTVDYSGDVDYLKQEFHGTQRVDNLVSLGDMGVSGVLEQTGVNVAGYASASTLTLASQLFASDSAQLINNAAEIGYLTGGVRQSGANTANMAVAEYAIGTAVQVIEYGAVQRVDNHLALSAGAAVDAFIVQSGINVGNVMISDTVDRAHRVFVGDQIVTNVITLAELTDARIVQFGSNIANEVHSNKIGKITQVSKGIQQVTNEVYGPDGQLVIGDNIQQFSENLVNKTYLGMPDSGPDNGVLEVNQDADYPQTSSGGGGGGSQGGNSVIINR